jgi:hypothetical protein
MRQRVRFFGDLDFTEDDACLYRKPRPARNGDEAHQGLRVT